MSSEDKGCVRITDITKKTFLGGYSIDSQFLFKERIKGTTAIEIYQKNKSYQNHFCDNSSLAAIGGVNVVTIVTLKPIDCIFSIEKPLICKDKSLPYLAWGFGLTPSQREKTVPILAIAWDRFI